jgi:hypothetical protein
MTRALDGGRQHPLMLGAIAGYSTWNDLAALQHEPAQQLVVLVVNKCNFVFAQTARFPSSSIKSFSHDSLISRNSISNFCFFRRSASIPRLSERNSDLSRGSSQSFRLLNARIQINLGNNRQKTDDPFIDLESSLKQRWHAG